MATVASLVVDLTANTARFHRNMTQAQKTMQQLRRTAMSVTRTLDDVASAGKKAAVGLAAIAAAATGVLQTTATFEKSMMRVKAVSQASVAEYKAMEKAALDMAKATQYTAQQVAEGMGYMAMAGFKSNEIIGAMPTVLRLATAGMMDLATSADIVTNILTGYGLAVEDLEAATDVLVSAMTGANVDLEMLGESFKYVGPIAKGAGVSFEVTAAAIALLGNAGIQGSMAGTSLRQALSRLLNPTKAVQDRLKKLGVQTKTATGELLPFENIIAQLEKSGATAADMMEIFGDRAGPAMAALVSQGSDALMTFIDRLRESGGLAERIEKEQLNTLSGQWDILKSQIQGVAITLGQDLMPYARTLIYIGQQIVGLFDNLDASQRAQITQWIALGGAILGIVSVLGVTAFAISAFIKGLLLLGSVVGLLTSPVVVGFTLIALAVAALKTAWDNNWLGIKDKTIEIVDAITEKWESLKTWWDTSDFGQKVREAWDRIKDVWASDELTLPQKVLKTVSIVAETIADLVPCIRRIWDTWKDEDLSFGQKVLKTVTIVASSVAGLIESIMAWWTGVALNLVERGATLLGLNPDDLWIVQFLRDLNTIWKDSDLSFGQKIVETVKLLPGGTALVGFFQSIIDVWKRDDLTLPEKIVQTLKLTAGGIGSLIESIITLWINTTVALTEKVVTLLGLSPEDNALLGFLKKLQAIWNDEELSFGTKIIKTVDLLPGGTALVGFFQSIIDVWKSEDLSLPEKVLETVKLVASGVAGLIESIVTWWTNASVTLAEKVVTLLGLTPDENALVDFMRQLQTIWNNEELSFGQKIVKTIELVPGGQALTGFFAEIKSIWTDSSLTLPQKVVKTVSLTATRVADLIESIMVWWTGATLQLVRRGAEILGLDPDSLWVVGFLEALNNIWAEQELSLGQKIVKTIELVPGGQALVAFVQSIVDVWKDSELSLPEKIIETVKLTVSAVTGLIESIVTWWINTSVTLSEKVVSLLGLNPEENALVGFLQKLQEIWNNEELEFAEKVVETLKLIPGVKVISDFVARIKQVWADTDLTLGEKVTETIEISLDQAAVRIGLASLVAVLSWKVLPGVLRSLGSAITAAIPALAAGGLVLGKITVAGALLTLAAGAIGWVFGDKEGRAAWVDAIHESLKGINMDEPVSIPISIMGVLEATFKFGTQGIQNMRTAIQKYKKQLEEWTPQMGVGKLEIPEWLRKFVDLGLSVAEFLSQGLLLGFDLADLLLLAVEKAVVGALHAFLEAGKKLGNAILDGIASALDKILPDFLTPDWVKKRVETMQAQQEAALSVTEQERQMLSVTEQERQMLAALVQLEARIDGIEGMAAVAEVVFNRMAANPKYYGGTIEEVIRKGGQFEPVMSGAFDTLLESGRIAADALEAVDLALRRLAEGAGITAGATHFANLDIVQRRYEAARAAGRSYAGAWFLDPTQFISTATIGRHTFGYGSWERYQSGTPWTGWGPLDEVVGVVHRREAVIPWEALRKGIPGVLEFLGVPGFQTGRAVSIPGLVEAQSTVTTMNDMFRNLGKTILAGLAKLFEIIAGAIEALAVALVGEEKVAEIKAFFAQMRAGLQDYIDSLSEVDSFGDIVKDTTEQVDGLSSALEDAIAAVEDTLKTWVRKVPILSDALAAYENAVKPREEGGLGLGTAGGIAAAALAALSASSEELRNAIEAVSQGFAALIEPLNGLLRSLGPAGAGGLVGAGIGYGAAMLLGMANPIIGVVAGGLMGLFGGVAQQQAEAAELQIEAANQLVQAARNMNTEARYGAIDQMRRSIAETERTISDLQASISGVTTAGAVGGGIAGAAIGFALFGPLGLLLGGLFGAAAGGSVAHSMRQDEIEAITKQLEAQQESLDQLIEDFKGVLGIMVSDLVSSVRSAFSAETVEAFSAQLETSLLMHVRNALIAGFLESAAMRPLFEMLSDQIFEAVRDGVTSAGELDAIRDTISQISDHSEQFYSVLDELGLGMKDLKKSVDSVNSALRNVPSGFKIALRRFQVADPIPLAEGGIVTRPTFAMVGERGPEAVVPLDEAGGKIVVEVHVEGSIYADDFEDRVRRAVVKGARDAGLGRYGLAGDVAWA